MNREFLELYNRELRILYGSSKEFAEDYPGIADRLGGLIEENMDPMMAGLLQGSAFLAARVQLKLKHEFPEFTNNLLEQLVPHYLAPTPSTALLRIEPPFAEPNLKDGMHIKAGGYAEARFVERERRIACKFRLTADVTLWPFEIAQAEYLAAPSALQATGLESGPGAVSGMRLTFMRRTQVRFDEEPTAKQVRTKPESWISRCRTNELPIYITCSEGDAVRLYEMLVGHTLSIHIRYLDSNGDAVLVKAPQGSLQQIGFDDAEPLFLSDGRMFRGFDLLREYFSLPQKFLGFKLTGLRTLFGRVDTNQLDVIFSFDQLDPRLTAAVRPHSFTLFAVPVVNLFEMTAARVPVRANEHEHHVVADRTRHLDFEPHRILSVHAHFTGSSHKTEVYPLYSAPPLHVSENDAIYYSLRRSQRRRSSEEKRQTGTSGYTGTDIFLSLANQGGIGDLAIAELSVRALCSNRHLTENLPVGKGGTDFILEEKTNLTLNCISGPTRPAESIIVANTGADAALRGSTAWRLISLLNLNHLGITGRGTEKSASALRELLSLFAAPHDAVINRRIRGILVVESRAIVRRVRQHNGTGVVRGLEIAVTLDEKAFEGSGIFLFGAVLERFFVEYAPMNNAVQTVIRSNERGDVMRWPVRLGRRIEL
jgi:type VI secretion system protein ImpG